MPDLPTIDGAEADIAVDRDGNIFAVLTLHNGYVTHSFALPVEDAFSISRDWLQALAARGHREAAFCWSAIQAKVAENC
jgi:hypothetical protein